MFFLTSAMILPQDLLCLWQCFFGRTLSQMKLHNEYFMGSWTDPRESPFFCDYGLLSWPLSLQCLLCHERKNYTTGQLSDTGDTKLCTFLSRTVNLHLNEILFHAAVALNISSHSSSPYPSHLSLSLLSLSHSPSLTYTSPSFLLPVCTMPLYAVHNIQRCKFHLGNGQSWEVTLSVRCSNIRQPVLLWRRIQRRGEEVMNNLLELHSYLILSIALCGSMCFYSQSFAAKGVFSSTGL